MGIKGARDRIIAELLRPPSEEDASINNIKSRISYCIQQSSYPDLGTADVSDDNVRVEILVDLRRATDATGEIAIAWA